MINIIKVTDTEITFREKGSKKQVTRKLKPVISNVSKFRFNKNVYYLVEAYSKYGAEYEVFNYLTDINWYCLDWSDLEDALKIFAEKWNSILQKENEYVPSAPDTSKFIAVKNGDISFRKDYYYSRASWLSHDYYPVLITRGTAIKLDEIPQEFYDELFTLLVDGLTSGLTIDNKTPRIGCILGTAGIGWGLKNA